MMYAEIVAMAIQNFKLSKIDKNNCSHMDPVLTKRMLFEFWKSIHKLKSYGTFYLEKWHVFGEKCM